MRRPRRPPDDDDQLVLFEEPVKRPTRLEEWRVEIDDWTERPFPWDEVESQPPAYMTS